MPKNDALSVISTPNISIAPSAHIQNTTAVAKPASTSSALDNVPLAGIRDAAVQGAKIVAAVAPVPWLGPAMELVGVIISLCQNVSRNRRAAEELARHCKALADTIQKTYTVSGKSVLGEMKSELESLLRRIKEQIEEWTKLNYVMALAKQETISGKIKSYLDEIDQFFKRYTIVAHTEQIRSQETFEAKNKKDFEELVMYLADAGTARELEHKCLEVKIDTMREEITVLIGLVQKILFLKLRDGPLEQRRTLESTLSAIVRSSRVMPPDIELTESLIQRPEFPILGNGVFDIYRGTCFGNIPCALKVVRHVNIGPDTRRRFKRQHNHWRSIQDADRGKHILPLIGIIYRDFGPSPFLCLVSPWMEKGNALDHVKKNEDLDRIDMIRKVAEGLKVLHTHQPPLAHGYVRASNILINDFGDPLLADFGLLRIVEDVMAEQMSYSSFPVSSQSFRWLAPELLVASEHQLSTKSDIFMYAMTVLELMTAETPFSHIKRDHEVLVYRFKGGRPRRSEGEYGGKVRQRGLDDRLWEFLERCWADDSDDRPTIHEVLEFLSPPKH